MLPIKIFYHVYIPDDERSQDWTWFVDSQLQLIIQSNLKQACCQCLLTVTMPKFWTHQLGMQFHADKNPHQALTFGQKVEEYLNKRYPWVIILEIRDISANLFEGLTLKYLWQLSKKEDFYALYMHTKGVRFNTAPVANWREVLNYCHITHWQQAVEHLTYKKVVGVMDSLESTSILSGNFFWTRSDHVRSLHDPLESHLYTDDTHMWPHANSYRYAFELWILSNKPSVHYLLNTKTNHYDEYCFVENLPRIL